MVLEEARPEDVSHRRRAHRQARMPGIRLLNRVHGKAANSINAKLVKLSLIENCLLQRRGALSVQRSSPPYRKRCLIGIRTSSVFLAASYSAPKLPRTGVAMHEPRIISFHDIM